ncbi:MAG: hypothetical protein COA78_03770 [Blastopirellula sp.]|nr:MAG: hypothetical protein COA78_03770 [Blastopirellula sp.]
MSVPSKTVGWIDLQLVRKSVTNRLDGNFSDLASPANGTADIAAAILPLAVAQQKKSEKTVYYSARCELLQQELREEYRKLLSA